MRHAIMIDLGYDYHLNPYHLINIIALLLYAYN